MCIRRKWMGKKLRPQNLIQYSQDGKNRSEKVVKYSDRYGLWGGNSHSHSLGTMQICRKRAPQLRPPLGLGTNCTYMNISRETMRKARSPPDISILRLAAKKNPTPPLSVDDSTTLLHFSPSLAAVASVFRYIHRFSCHVLQPSRPISRSRSGLPRTSWCCGRVVLFRPLQSI